MSEEIFDNRQHEVSQPSSEEQPLLADSQSPKRVPGHLPPSAWLVVIAEVCERFAYYGTIGPLQNYLQNAPGDSINAPGLAQASTINQFFAFGCNATTFAGAIVADQYLRRFGTILMACFVSIFGSSALLLSSTQIIGTWEASVSTLMLGVVLLGFGSGGIKPNVNSLLAEQLDRDDPREHESSSGSYVTIDRAMTIQRMFALFYLLINLSSFSPLLTVFLEQWFGFTAAFSVPTVMLVAGTIIYFLARNRFVRTQPNGAVLWDALKVILIAFLNRGSLEAAKATSDTSTWPVSKFTWTDEFVDELAIAIQSFSILAWFPLYWMGWLQMQSNIISQARKMETHRVPNDILINLDPLMIVVLVPVLENIVYPFLRSQRFELRHVSRITLGFILMSVAMAYAGFVQYLINHAPPCYDYPLSSDCLNGKVPNQVHIAIQVPAYLLIAISEIMAVPTGYEYCFTQAPTSMKSITMFVFMFMVSIRAFLAMLMNLLTASTGPMLMFGILSIISFLAGMALYYLFWK